MRAPVRNPAPITPPPHEITLSTVVYGERLFILGSGQPLILKSLAMPLGLPPPSVSVSVEVELYQ